MFWLLLSSAYTASRPFLLLTASPVSKLECTRRWMAIQPGELTSNDQRVIPYCVTSCSAIKTGGRRRKKKEEREDVQSYDTFFPRNC